MKHLVIWTRNIICLQKYICKNEKTTDHCRDSPFWNQKLSFFSLSVLTPGRWLLKDEQDPKKKINESGRESGRFCVVGVYGRDCQSCLYHCAWPGACARWPGSHNLLPSVWLKGPWSRGPRCAVLSHARDGWTGALAVDWSHQTPPMVVLLYWGFETRSRGLGLLHPRYSFSTNPSESLICFYRISEFVLCVKL